MKPPSCNFHRNRVSRLRIKKLLLGRGLAKPLEALRYQRDLLNMVRQLETLETELVKSKAELAALMNLQPGTPFELADAPEGWAIPTVPYKLSDLEVLAMVRRPELREESYLARNAVLETRMSILKLFPNAQLFAGLNYDSNKYLVNDQWADVGTQVSWNLMNLFSIPKILKGNDLREELAPLRRQAIRMSVLSQVHVAWHQRFAAEKNFRRADELAHVQDKIEAHVENAVKSRSETKLEAVRTKVETLLARRARDMSYAEMMNAQDAIYQAAGFDTVPAVVADASLSGLADAIAAQNRVIADGAVLQGLFGSQALAGGEGDYKQVSESWRPAIDDLTASNGAEGGTAAVRLVSGMPWESLGSLKSAR